MAAACSGSVGVVRVLIAAGADVRAMDARGETPLSYAKKEREEGREAAEGRGRDARSALSAVWHDPRG